jgi:hypothetical protein
MGAGHGRVGGARDPQKLVRAPGVVKPSHKSPDLQSFSSCHISQ